MKDGYDVQDGFRELLALLLAIPEAEIQYSENEKLTSKTYSITVNIPESLGCEEE